MSWSFSSGIVPVNEVGAALERASEESMKHYTASDEEKTAMQTQIDLAIDAAQTIAASGALGSESIVASLSGHANPGFERRQGYSNNSIVINLYQRGNDEN